MSVFESIPARYHWFFNSWLRLEPRCRSEDIGEGIEARVADPLWMLGRQWQLAEFAGEDAASPIRVELDVQTEPLASVTLGASGAAPISLSSTQPLEMLVEREPVGWSLRARLQAGQRFERCLAEGGGASAESLIESLRTAYAIEAVSGEDKVKVDRAAQRLLRVAAGRVIDGEQLLAAASAGPLPGVPAGIADLVAAAIADLRAWRAAMGSEPTDSDGSAWQSSRLDYRFRIAGPGDERVLGAPDYKNGDLDWYACRIEKSSDAGWPAAQQEIRTPTRVSFPGMPHRRWWAFEDHQIDLGNLDVATPDLAHLLLMEFAMIYGDDWFVVPLDLDLGSLTRLTRVEVFDVFGDAETLSRIHTDGPTPRERWEMFSLTRDDDLRGAGLDGLLFLPPVAGFRDESPPLEEVRFIRDEGANMIWGVERRVQNRIGDAIEGFDAHSERHGREQEWEAERAGTGGAAPDQADAGEGPPRYRLASPVPANWIPFVPARTDPFKRSIRLLRAQMLRNQGDDRPSPIPALTRVLDPFDLLWLQEDAVPRAGVKVQLTKQRVRWFDGETHMWLGRKAVVGRGEGSSGLRFDVIEPEKR